MLAYGSMLCSHVSMVMEEGVMTAASSSLDGLHDHRRCRHDRCRRPYFAAAARGIVFQRCANGHPFLYPRLVCPRLP